MEFHGISLKSEFFMDDTQKNMKMKINYMGRAKPDVRPPVAAISSAKSI